MRSAADADRQKLVPGVGFSWLDPGQVVGKPLPLEVLLGGVGSEPNRSKRGLVDGTFASRNVELGRRLTEVQ
jgi:hypothetical protein